MSDKNFKVKNGIDAVGPITVSPSSNSITGLIINSVSGGTNITFNRNGSQVGYIDEWGGLVTSGGIQVAQPWYTRSPGIEAQSFFWAGSSTRSTAGFGGTYSGTNPVIYISSHSNGTNDLTQWIKPDNTVLAKVDYLGNITANDLTLSGNLTVNGTTTNLNSTNLVIEDKNIILADVATPTDTTANGAGITIKGATDKTLSWIQSTKSFTTSDPFIIDGTNSTTVPLLVKVPTNQTTNSFEIKDNQGYSLFRVTAPAGGTAYNGGMWVRPWGTGNIGAMGTDSYQGFYFVSPSTSSINFGTPGGGRAFEIVVGDTFNRYKIQGSGTGVAPIFTTAGNDTDVNMNIYPKGAGKIGINNASPTGYIHAISSSSSVVGLIVEGATGQTSTNIFEVQRAGGGDASFGVSHNYIDLNRNTTAAASMTIYGANSGAVPLYVKGRASQSVNLTEWQNSSGQVRASIGSTGGLSLNYANGIKLYNAANTDYASLWMDNGSGGVNLYTKLNYPLLIGNMGVDTGAWLTLALSSATQVGQVIRGYTSQSANLQEWQSTGGSVLASIDSAGSLNLASGKQLIFNNGLGTRINFGYGAAYQLGIDDYTIAIEPDNSSNIGKVAVRPSSATYGISYTNPIELYANGQIKQNLTVAANIGLTIKAAASQTASLQEWQNNSGTAVAKIASNGELTLKPIPFSGGVSGGIYLGDTSDAWVPGSFKIKVDNGGIPRFGFTAPNASSEALTINGNSVGVQTAAPSSIFQVTGNGAANIVSIIKGVASQTADLMQWRDSSDTVLNTITSGGTLVIGGTSPVNSLFGITLVNKTLASYYSSNNSSYFTVFNLTRGNTTGAWMNIGTVGDSSNGVASIDIRDGGNGQLFSVGYNGNTSVILNSPSAVALTIKSAASQTAAVQQWQNSSGGVLSEIRNTGQFRSGVGAIFGNASGYTAGLVSLFNNSASLIPLVVLAHSSQTADLQQWINSSSTIVAKVDAAGNITDASNTAWLSPIGSGSDDAPTIQALIDGGKKEIRLGSGQWTFSTRIKVPNGVTIRGTGTSRSSTTGTRVNAVALIASEGTVRDIMFTGAGENSQNELGGGGIAVLGGRVINCSVTDSRYVLAPTRQPHGYLKNFMSKMQGSYGSVKVAILGDSLSENTSTTSWYGYLFDSTTTATGYYLGSYFSHQIAPSEVDNMAIGGQGAYLLSAQLAMTKETLRTGGYQNQVLDGDNVSTAPFFNRNYNLAILAIGQNGGEDWKAHLEYVVKTIRDKGIDVIILTQNPASGNPTSRAGDEYYYRSMAETYGCLLIDTQAYYRLEVEFGRALGTTADLFGDSVHQSTQGHQLYAKAILNGILDYDSTITVPANKTVVSRSYIPAQSDRATVIAGINAYYLVKKPDVARDISGVTYTTATDTSIRNPIYGRGTLTSSVTTIASSGYATWGVEYATAAYIIYRENATTNILTVSLQGGGSTLATLTTGVTNGRTSVQKVTLNGGYSANRPIRITNTSGDPVQIYGVVFETHADVAFNRNSDGSYPGVKLNGTWSSGYFLDMANYGGLKTPYTSTVNDSVTFKFYGDGLRFATSYGKNSGIIQVKIDDTTYTAVDTYLNINEYGVYTHFYGGLQYGLHTATITLTGANASVTGNLGDGARFGLHRISAVRSSWYLTQDQQLAPNSDISANVNFLASPTISSAGGAGAVDLTIKGATTVGSGTTEKLISFKSSANSEIGYVADTGYGATLSQFNYLYTTTVQGWNGVGGAINFANATPITVLPQSSSVTSLVVKGVASQSADLQQWQNSSGTALGKMDANGNFSAISKSFDIEHPTKENMRLRYASLEGPENGVYIRGTAITNIIELPDYWTGLVHEDSITVSLTSVGSAQNIYVKKIEDNKIYIGGNLEKAFFTVYGERKDIDKLTVEY